MAYNMFRFLNAHEDYYDLALKEIQEGHKKSHWMWFIFPQMRGLGYSDKSEFYGFINLSEAKDFFNNTVLNKNLRDICQTLLNLSEDINHIMGNYIDVLKLRSSMTLFDYISPNDIFNDVLNKFFNGSKDLKTLSIIRHE